MRSASRLRIVIPGGTGRLGLLLARHFHQQGHFVSTISRFPKPRAWEAVHWDGETLGEWASSIEDADIVINLAGYSVLNRPTLEHTAAMLRSRVRTTEILGQAIAQCHRPPRSWLNAGTTNIYPDSGDRELIEAQRDANDSPLNLPKTWEEAVFAAPVSNTRKLVLRLAPVMSPEFGAFPLFLRMVRCGLGGEIGPGVQFVDWVHDFDFVHAIEFLIQRDDIAGVVNITSPLPLPNRQFMCNLRRAWCTSYWGVPTPVWLVATISRVLRVQPELVLKSRRVIPRTLLDSGFAFHFPEWRGACENLVQRWRMLHEASVT